MTDFPAGMPTSGRVDADPANLLRDVFLANQGRIRADLVDNMIGRHSFTYGQAIHDAWQQLQDEGYVVRNGDHWEWPIQMHASGGRKFFRTVVTVEVLTADEPADFAYLSDLHYMVTDGDASGDWTTTSEEVSPDRMRELLIAQGSDPDFLDAGVDVED